MGVVEVGGDGDDGLADLGAEGVGCARGELAEDDGGDFLGGDDAFGAIERDGDAGGVVLALDNAVGEVGQVGCGVGEGAAHESLDAGDGGGRELDGAVGGVVADDGAGGAVGCGLEADDAREKRAVLRVVDGPRALLVEDGDEAVGGAEVDAEDGFC